ncbi:bifunctional metallophosphatase/5'-nucleotidase [Azospirillum sp.]|uniref:bifunctional metallophosphatase/5'-nucleotidase n=1 Tax=Azospirillum sp. TaxID=34012 RepID=UPI003D738343
MRVLRIAAKVSAWALAALLVVAGAALAAEPVRFTLLYAHSTTELQEQQGRGGLARLAAAVKAERARGQPVFLLHGGQAFAPSVLSFYDEGAHMIDLLNDLQIDAMAALNRDFHYGEDVLLARAHEANFPMVTSNAIDRTTGRVHDGLVDSVVLKAGPLRIGVLAATPARTREVARVTRTDVPDPAVVLAAKAKAMRAGGIDLVVVLTGNSGDTHKAVIAAGIADIVLYQDRGKAYEVVHDGKRLAASVDAQAGWVLALDAVVVPGVGGGKASSLQPSLAARLIDTAAVPPDAAMASRVKVYTDRLDAQLGLQVGRLDGALDTRREAVRGGENAFANQIADAVRAALDADLALINGGAIRGDRQYAAGATLTRRDIFTELPYHDPVVLLDLTGKELLDTLELAYGAVEQLHGRFLHLSGARVTVDLTKPAGQRVVELTIGGKPVERERHYRVGTLSYLAAGNDGYGLLAAAPRLVGERDADFASMLLIGSVARDGVLKPALDGRIALRR